MKDKYLDKIFCGDYYDEEYKVLKERFKKEPSENDVLWSIFNKAFVFYYGRKNLDGVNEVLEAMKEVLRGEGKTDEEVKKHLVKNIEKQKQLKQFLDNEDEDKQLDRILRQENYGINTFDKEYKLQEEINKFYKNRNDKKYYYKILNACDKYIEFSPKIKEVTLKQNPFLGLYSNTGYDKKFQLYKLYNEFEKAEDVAKEAIENWGLKSVWEKRLVTLGKYKIKKEKEKIKVVEKSNS